LEAMSRGLPVICLAMGGPRQFVDSSCGRAVPVLGMTPTGVVAGLAEAIGELESDPSLLAQLSEGALNRAIATQWSTQVARVYAEVEKVL